MHLDADAGAVRNAVREKGKNRFQSLLILCTDFGKEYSKTKCGKSRILPKMRCGSMGGHTDHRDRIALLLNLYAALFLYDILRLLKIFLGKLRKLQNRFLRNRIDRNTGCKRAKDSFRLSGLPQGSLQCAFFNVDNGELRVRREAHLARFFLLIIVGQICRSGFLIRSENQANPFLQLITELFNRTHRIKGTKNRSLIVTHASTVYNAVLLQKGKRVGHRPSLSGGNNIQVSENIETVRKFR